MLVDKNIILEIFRHMEEAEVEYVLLRNIGGELPCQLAAKKDIDILVKKTSKDKFHEFVIRDGWKQIRHPWDFENNFVFLYGMDRLEFYERDGIYLDICYQLCCRSVNAGEWMPVDQMIQDSVWHNRKRNARWQWYEMGNEDKLVHLLTRCIFDKKAFSEGYIMELLSLLEKTNKDALMRRLETIFFKFSPQVVEMMENNQFEDIYNAYISFTEY